MNKYKANVFGSACGSNRGASSLSGAQKNAFVNEHNTRRQQIANGSNGQPRGVIPNLSYSDELAKVAQR